MLHVEKALPENRQGFLYAGIKHRYLFCSKMNPSGNSSEVGNNCEK